MGHFCRSWVTFSQPVVVDINVENKLPDFSSNSITVIN